MACEFDAPFELGCVTFHLISGRTLTDGTMSAPPGTLLAMMEVWMWAGPDERRLWSAACGGRTGAALLVAWRWIIGLYFLGFQLWYWGRSVGPCRRMM